MFVMVHPKPSLTFNNQLDNFWNGCSSPMKENFAAFNSKRLEDLLPDFLFYEEFVIDPVELENRSLTPERSTFKSKWGHLFKP